MNFIKKTAGVGLLAFGLAACGGGSDGGGRVGGGATSSGAGNAGSNNAGTGGTPVADRTGKANYVGTFTAKIKPTGSFGERYAGGTFTGDVTADADFDKDQIDLELVGRRKEGVIDAYDAEFEDAQIKGRDFWGRGEENIALSVEDGGSLISRDGNARVRGAFAGGGSQISGETASLEKDRSVTIKTDFSASEQ